MDVLIKDVVPSNNSPLLETFHAALREAARQHRLPNTWLNDLVGGFLRDAGTALEGSLWRTSGMLAVYVPPSEYILALKLFAGR